MATNRYLVNGAIQTSIVPDNVSTQKVAVDKGGTLVGTRKEINLIEGSNVTLTVADNAGSDRVDVTVAATSTAPANMATVSTAEVTYYVRSDGNDSNDGLASDSAHSLLTIQAAINKLPQHVNHAYVVDIGAGNFAGFGMTGRNVNIQGSLNITGALGQVTVGGGRRNSGTGGAGSDTFTLVDLSGSGDWTPNELRGYLLYIPSRAEYRVIRNNTATTINCVGAFGATLNGLAYQIYEQTTVITSVNALLNSYCCVFLNNSAYRDAFYINNIKVSQPTGKGGFFNKDCAPQYVRCRSGGAAVAAFVFQSIGQEVQVSDCYGHNASSGFSFLGAVCRTVTRNYAFTASSSGFSYSYSRSTGLTYAYADSCATGLTFFSSEMAACGNLYGDSNTYGISISYCNQVYIATALITNSTTGGISLWGGTRYNFQNVTVTTVTAGSGLWVNGMQNAVSISPSLTISGASRYGIEMNLNAAVSGQQRSAGGQLLLEGATHTISNNTLGGILVGNGGRIIMTAVTGTGNGGYGLTLQEGSCAVVATPTSFVTGSSGDVTIDDGGNPLTWATHFAANGDSVTNTNNLCRIVRID